MPPRDSALDATMIARARRLLAGPDTRESIWPALCAAAFAASTALALATAMILAPPVTTTPVAERTR